HTNPFTTLSRPPIISTRLPYTTLFRSNESDKLNSYKKKAIAKAIESCRGELIVTTDADCRMGTQWLKTIVGYFEQQDLYMLSSPDRKSTRLNSSHVKISYAVFCLKKKI